MCFNYTFISYISTPIKKKHTHICYYLLGFVLPALSQKGDYNWIIMELRVQFDSGQMWHWRWMQIGNLVKSKNCSAESKRGSHYKCCWWHVSSDISRCDQPPSWTSPSILVRNSFSFIRLLLYLDEHELSAFLWFCGPWLQDLLRLRLFFWHWKISVLPWSIRLLNLMSILLSGRNSFAGTRRALGWSTCAMREKNTTSYKWHNITLSRTLMIICLFSHPTLIFSSPGQLHMIHRKWRSSPAEWLFIVKCWRRSPNISTPTSHIYSSAIHIIHTLIHCLHWFCSLFFCSQTRFSLWLILIVHPNLRQRVAVPYACDKRLLNLH